MNTSRTRQSRWLIAAGTLVTAAAAAPPPGAAASTSSAPVGAGAATSYREREAPTSVGVNDRPGKAERVRRVGTGRGEVSRLRVTGRIADRTRDTPPRPLPRSAEDDGSITQAADTGLGGVGAVTVTGTLGDGPHGPAGDGTNDFDFYGVDVPAGHRLVADTSGSAAAAGSLLVVYDARGRQLAVSATGGSTAGTSRIAVTPRTPGRLFVMVAGSAASPQPSDPFKSGSGSGGAATGDYALSVSVQRADRDQYAVYLRRGDVLGAAVDGAADTVRIATPSGKERMGSVGVDASVLFPPASPLPKKGRATVAYVAERAGWHTVSVDGSPGRYALRLGVHRPGAEGDGRQTVLVDFDGGPVDLATLRSPGLHTLSPFAAFLPRWGLPESQAGALSDRITDEIRAALVDEVEGDDGRLDVRVVSSRTHPELRGRKNVTRVIVGGTVAEAGVDTIGTSEGVDPGNFAHEQIALALLDRLSDTADRTFSLNHYLTPASDREAFIAQAVGNIAAHEVAHTLGSFHTDNTVIDQLMDSGGRTGFAAIYGVGPDGVGGTADDVNLRLGTDRFASTEGFTGLEDTRNNTRWAFAHR